MEFESFEKIGRLSRKIVVTEKIDGTNGQIAIGEDGEFRVGSRSRWITPEDDNYGFAAWAYAHKDDLMQMGPGRHFGEWWGQGIQRKYGMTEKRFSLFNSGRWSNAENRPSCCHVVPVLGVIDFDTVAIAQLMADLAANGSAASPGFMKPEGIIIFHSQTRRLYKKTFEKDEEGKGEQ